MTDQPDKPTDDTTAEEPDTRRVVVRRDELGRPVETVEASDPAAAIHWNDDLWHPLR